MVPLSSSSQSQTQTQFQIQLYCRLRYRHRLQAVPMLFVLCTIDRGNCLCPTMEFALKPSQSTKLSRTHNASSRTCRCVPHRNQEWFQDLSRDCHDSGLSYLPMLKHILLQDQLSPTRRKKAPNYMNLPDRMTTLSRQSAAYHKTLPVPVAKRHCTSASPAGRLLTHSSVPLTRLSSPVVRSPRSLSTLRSFPRNRPVMDCVKVMSLRELLQRREADAGGGDTRKQRRGSDLDDHA